MASLSLTFPEKDQPTVIALTGARLTIGRLPFNTIQIIDRTVSGFHAELINEHGHYRLHDRGSSNGTFVNGQKIADYHLNEACTIAFGTVEAKFSPAEVAANEEAESFPTRSEINSVRKENAELRATVDALREEATALRQARPIENGGVPLAVTKEEFDSVVVERERLKETQLKLGEEVERLKTDLAVLRRDRVNLQLAYDGVQRELQELREKAGVVEATTLAPKAAAVAVAAQAVAGQASANQAAALDETVRIEVPLPSAPPAPKLTPESPAIAAEAPKPAPVTPVVPNVEPSPSRPMKPLAPLPKAPVIAAAPVVAAAPVAAPVSAPPATPPKAPGGLGGGFRPLGKPPTAPGGGDTSTSLPTAPASRMPPPRPLPTAKLPTQPTVKLNPAPAPKVGPKGTQKLVE